MKRIAFILFLIISLSLVAKENISLNDFKAVVVKTIPEAGSIKVDPKLDKIEITFSKNMKDKSWSFVQYSKETYPKITGDIKLKDNKRTFILPVDLEPGKLYILWLNTEKFNNFRDLNNIPSMPYLLTFQTEDK